MTNPDQSKVAVIGECMLELSLSAHLAPQGGTPANFAFGGDTLNMSVYLARLGVGVEYITALGDDSLSDWLITRWQVEGVACSHVFRHENKVPGMYMIELDECGERSFKYWRENSPASQIIDDSERQAKVFEAISNYPALFLSGISLAILKPAARDKLIDFLFGYRASGGQVIFDCNHRPNLWSSSDAAIDCYQRIYQATDIALPTYEDESALFGYQSPEQAIESIHNLGVNEVILKMGEKGCQYSHGKNQGVVSVQSVNVVDTTSAGDSFNAGYLSVRLQGGTIEDACLQGHALASTVIQHKGAIIPIQAMAHMITN